MHEISETISSCVLKLQCLSASKYYNQKSAEILSKNSITYTRLERQLTITYKMIDDIEILQHYNINRYIVSLFK